jgi:MoaA/NifB/PqqE/SkfB family radical SAM enzyme
MILQGAGEPLMHPRLLDIVSIVKEAGFNVTLLTNGTLLDRDVIEALIDMRVDTVKVSLWASSAAQYEMNYPGSHPDSFNKVLNGLKILSTLKAEKESAYPSVIVYHVINRHNFQTVDSMVDLALSTGCNGLFFSPVLNVGETLAPLELSQDEERMVEHSLLEAKKRLQSLSMAENVSLAVLRSRMKEPLWLTHPCYVAWFHSRIRVDGRVQPCGRCDLDFGTLKKNTFKEIWNGPAIRAFRRKGLTPKGIASMSKHCDCRKCCFVGDILRVDRVFKWIRPLVTATTGEMKAAVW